MQKKRTFFFPETRLLLSKISALTFIMSDRDAPEPSLKVTNGAGLKEKFSYGTRSLLRLHAGNYLVQCRPII